jgi:hypothetical protein
MRSRCTVHGDKYVYITRCAIDQCHISVNEQRPPLPVDLLGGEEGHFGMEVFVCPLPVKKTDTTKLASL